MMKEHMQQISTKRHRIITQRIYRREKGNIKLTSNKALNIKAQKVGGRNLYFGPTTPAF